jgi:predicted ArsR family transcriptional regulator
MTAPDLAQALGLPLAQAKERLQRLYATGLVAHNIYHGQEFYRSQETGAVYSQDDSAGSFPSKSKGHIT